MNESQIIRPRVLLSIQRALLGEVSAFLRGVTCSWDESTINIKCYFDGEPSENDQESMECVASEVMADFPEHDVQINTIRLDKPQSLKDQSLMAWAYLRKE